MLHSAQIKIKVKLIKTIYVTYYFFRNAKIFINKIKYLVKNKNMIISMNTLSTKNLYLLKKLHKFVLLFYFDSE